MNRYIIMLPVDRRTDWGTLVGHANLIRSTGCLAEPHRFHSRDREGIHWMITCTPERLTMVLLKTGAIFIREVEDPMLRTVAF